MGVELVKRTMKFLFKDFIKTKEVKQKSKEMNHGSICFNMIIHDGCVVSYELTATEKERVN